MRMEDFMTIRRIALVVFCSVIAMSVSSILRSHLGGASGAPYDSVAKIVRAGVQVSADTVAPGNVHAAAGALAVSRFRLGYLEFEDDPEATAQ